MPLRNASWYNANSSRSYPIDDIATSVDDAGLQVPNHIVTDLNLRFPSTAGKFAFFSALTSTPGAVSVVILGAATLDSTTLTPLAAVSLVKPIVHGQQYALESLYPGVGGWIVFGSGTDDYTYSGRFSTPRQSVINARAARSYVVPPVKNIGKQSLATSLTGLVQLKGSGDIEIVGETREIPISGTSSDPEDSAATVTRDVIVIRLRDNTTAGTGRNVFDVYSGPCGGRPESRTCDDPQPIEFISTVGPDCCGNITLEFRGCAGVAEVVGGGSGVVIDCNLGMADACVRQDHLPTADGTLPNEYENLCSDYSDIVTDESEIPEVDTSFPPLDESTGISDMPLPYLERFDDATVYDFITWSGSFALDATTDSYYQPDTAYGPIPNGTTLPSPPTGSYSTVGGTSGLNIALVDISGGSWSILNKKLITSVALLPGAIGVKHNAHVLINFRPRASDPTQKVYWSIEWDYDNTQLRLMHFDGRIKSLIASVPTDLIGLYTWALLEVSVYADANDPDAAWVTAVLSHGAPYASAAAMGPIQITDFGPATGVFGVGSLQAITNFSFVKIDHEVI